MITGISAKIIAQNREPAWRALLNKKSWALLCLFLGSILFDSRLAIAAWETAEKAPLHIRRHDRIIQVAPISQGGTFKMTGVIDLKINSDQGRALVARYKFPFTDELENLKIVSAEYFEPGLGNAPSLSRAVPQDGIFLDTPENKNAKPIFPFDPNRHWTIRFGDLKVGTLLRITYEVSNRQSRVPGLFSRTFTWGREFPEFGGTVTIESKDPLYIEASRAAQQPPNPPIALSQGKLPDGQFVYKIELKSMMYRKFSGEQGGSIGTSKIPRVQVSNQNSWLGTLDVLVPKFQPPLNDPLPNELNQVVDAAKAMPTIDDRINLAVERIKQLVKNADAWSPSEGLWAPQSLADIVRAKNADPKDLAYLTSVVLRAAGVNADVALVWKQNPTERLFIDENVKTPSMDLFNHAVIHVVDQGKSRYFDPSLPIVYTDGPLSDLQGSWALTLNRSPSHFQRIPVQSAIATSVKIQQVIDVRQDASVSGSGTIRVQGPMAAELRMLSTSQGKPQIEAYVRSLFGIATGSTSITPLMQFDTRNPRARNFDLNFTFVGQGLIYPRAPFRDVEISVPGIVGLPALATGQRATDLIMANNMTIDIETRLRNAVISDETSSSCLSLTSFASVIRETRESSDGILLTENIRFKQDRVSADSINTVVFKDELASYLNCISRSRVSTGVRPAYENPMYSLSAEEAASLKKPISLFNLQDIKILSAVDSKHLNPVIQMKSFLSVRDMIRRGLTSPQIRLEYVEALINSGSMGEGRFLPLHLQEAGKIFVSLGKELVKNPRYHRVHARILLADRRPKEALIAIQNAMSLERNISIDSIILSEIQMALGNTEKAEQQLIRASKLTGPRITRISALERLAKIYLARGDVKGYMNAYSSAINQSSRDPWLYSNFASGLIRLGQYDLGIQYARNASQILNNAEFNQTLALGLIKKAESLYFIRPGVPTNDATAIAKAEVLAIECLKYSRDHALAFRIAGHVSFTKAMNGDYASLIATQSYLAKAVELGATDPWVTERYQAASQALSSGASIVSIWSAYESARRLRIPAQAPAMNRVNPTSPSTLKPTPQ